MINILFIVGARPQFIKIAPLIRNINNNYKNEINYHILHTGQHYDVNMSAKFFEELNIPDPDINLEVGSGTHGYQTAEMIKGIESYIKKIKPDKLLVFGDTNSTIAGALAASKLHIPVAHVEAGLRSFNMNMPEEQNRILTDRLSSYLFCPTEKAVLNLEKEGVFDNKKLKGFADNRVVVKKTGDIMLDLIKMVLKKQKKIKIYKKYNFEKKSYILMTVHREENTDNINKLKKIINFVASLDYPILFLSHPRTKKIIENERFSIPENLIIEKPVGYLNMVLLENNAKYIFTDSGGVQKEAYFLKVPCLTLREETEWIETIDSKWNVLGFNSKFNSLNMAYKELKEREYNNFVHPSYYGNGNAANKILESLV